ncbi:myo-inositol transporter [Penicillium rubens]|uniref:Pc13g01920 protein n=2 Tax=Penicillium chrysogenum species complex TaxID=254878 RepID=B6H1B2_PENRW|nr:uncharacterized protein N7525_000321 [Penicillium rubens]KZN92469.1 Myo-inositol transporter [Penicillium chrysogenum]CAP91261.1 Pc13g01920 [Penicillium rubens Wisconsin 54-1255]KAF3024418.1 myo-inositol transporter [Penicillium rubens]KAJ5039931.1 hypothetical protein NUH16_009728 [Penicillium rubens]KAJ5842580.1 hypothetical protein N7525_000321 [Penicillium rubens]
MWPLNSKKDDNDTKIANPEPETKDDLESAHIEKIDASIDNIATSIDNLPVSWFVWLAALTASMAGLLFGYDTGIISGVLVVLGDSLDGRPATSSEKEMITSLCSGGAFIGAIFAGNTADRFGRKMAIYLGCVLFIAGAVLQAAAYTIVQMAIGRLVIGFGVGCGAMVLPLYVAEIAPAKARGKLIGLNNMSITGGQVISYAIGAAFASVPHGWRYMVGLGGVPAVVLGVLMPFCPESPRHLAYNGRRDEARVVLRKIYAKATEDQIDAVLLSICTACDQAREINESGSRFSKIKKLHTVPSNLRALVSACGLMVISQLSGFNALMYYSATLFSLVGFDNPTAVGLVVAGTNFIMTFVNMMVIDGMGRRKLLLSTVWGMSVGMVAIAVAFRWIPINMETMEVTTTGISPAAIAVLVFIIWFVVFYGVSVGNTAWMSTDFFPLEVRAMGTMWLTCSNWGANVIISSTFLSMMKAWTTSGAFGFFAAICGLGYIWIYFFYPEVSGLVLEEVKEVFEHGFGVDYARQLRKERKDIIEERMKTQEKPIAVGH